jgi:hypothetical protein
MTDIHHRIGVESPSTDDVYAALTAVDGLSGWWTGNTTGDPSLGGKIAAPSSHLPVRSRCLHPGQQHGRR